MLRRTLPALALAVAAAALAAGGPAPALAQGDTSAAFPDVHNNAIRYGHGLDVDGATAALAPAGQEGFGRTVIEAFGTAEDDAALSLRVFAKLDGAPVAAMQGIALAGAATTLDLGATAERAGENRYTAQLTADHAFGALARTRWASGAGSAHEAAPVGSALLLPILMVNAGSQSSVLAAQHVGANDMYLEIRASDPLTGDPLVVTQVTLGTNQGVEWDTAIERFIFDPNLLVANVDGGFLGPLRISSGGPAALVGYVDERNGPATAAIVARPVAAANAVQILPRVRAAADGGSLIAIANAGMAPIEATIRYDASEGAAPSERRIAIRGNGAAYVDLSPGGRSLPAAPSVAPFAGSATITATGPILAAVMEDWRAGGAVEALAGYNAFGPRDLSDRWAAPVVRRATDFVSSRIVVHNPTSAPAEGTLQLADAGGAPAAVIDLDLPAGGSTEVDLTDVDAFPIGTGSALVEAGAPVAVVVYEVRDASRDYPLVPLEVGLSDERGSNIEGTALLTPRGQDLRVEIELAPGMGSGSTLAAYIMQASCTEQDTPASHPLADVVGGRSDTILSGVGLRDVGDGFHAIRLKRAGGGPFAGRVACGVIGQVRGVEVADSAAVRAIQLAAGPDTIPTPAPTAGATEPTAQPSPSATRAPSATPTGAGPTGTPGPWVASVFMPVGHTGR